MLESLYFFSYIVFCRYIVFDSLTFEFRKFEERLLRFASIILCDKNKNRR